jgi:hypothetical protein
MASSNSVNGVESGPGTVTLTESNPFIKLLDTDQNKNVKLSVLDPDPDLYVFRPPGSVSHNYGSGSGSFHHQAKIAEKP